MSNNLPPGVTDSMIPGNRPQDIALQRQHDVIDNAIHKLDLAALFEAVGAVLKYENKLEKRRDALIDIVNYFSDHDIAQWLTVIEDSSQEPPEFQEPEYDKEKEMGL